MTTLEYAGSAKSDLADIRSFYLEISEQTFANVITDILETLDTIRLQPESGHIYRPQRRRLVTNKYKYIITYHYDGKTVKILGIYRYQNRT